MKLAIITLTTLALMTLSTEKIENSKDLEIIKTEVGLETSFSLLNDTKNKVSIYTGSGFVSLNIGSKAKISCKAGERIRWAYKNKKGTLIFKIQSKHCGKVLNLTEFLN